MTDTKRWMVPLLLLVGTMAEAAAEEVTLTTYHPSPRGVYEELRTTDSTYLATAAGNVGVGTANPQVKLDVQDGAIRAGGGLIIEIRTSDPANPSTGQLWLRTDL